jgi:hypothetical protein
MRGTEHPAEGGRPLLAFGFAVPIAMLGGLIELGGAEFRLPVLAGPLRHPVGRAVPLNLAVSLVTGSYWAPWWADCWSASYLPPRSRWGWA